MTSINPDDLQALAERIINSGVLGRSKTYAAILRYLVECSIRGENPKEAAIAVDVLGREADFDVARDSIVRVHIYHLRNKLKVYYARHGKQEKYRIDIPKGQYLISTHLQEEGKPGADAAAVRAAGRPSFTPWLAGLAVVLLGLNLVSPWFESDDGSRPVAGPAESGRQPWQAILADDQPVLLVIGDYFIFGEVDDTGNVQRMVREFDINSENDLAAFQSKHQEAGRHYFNLDLSYIPVSIANAMARIMPLLGAKAGQVSVKMMSDLNTADLASSHIIYLGYLSGMDSLFDLMFADSTLSLGTTFDELINLETDEHYLGSSGLAIGENSFQDYGMASTFPSPNGHQFILIAGMRDEGLINIARQITSAASLDAIADGLGVENSRSFEVLYEVYGFDNTNFGGELVYSGALDTKVIWETRLIDNR